MLTKQERKGNKIRFLEQLSKVAEFHIISTNFRNKTPASIISNTPYRFRFSYIFKNLNKIDPIVSNLGKISGWHSWSDNYDLNNEPFSNCTQHGLEARLGWTFYGSFEFTPFLGSIILNKTVIFSKEVQDDTSHIIAGLIYCLHGETREFPKITDKQKQILRMIGEGAQDKQIAHVLNISISAVQKQKIAIRANFGVNTIEEAIVHAAKSGFFN